MATIVTALLNNDSLALMAGGLWNDYAQDTILQVGFDRILINAGREGEGTVKLSYGALGDPVFGLVLMVFLGLFFGGLCDFLILCAIGRGFLGVIFDGGFMRLGSIRHVSSDAALRLVSTIGGIFALNAAFDDQGVGVCELDVDIFLINPR